jgi:hypothetical protein
MTHYGRAGEVASFRAQVYAQTSSPQLENPFYSVPMAVPNLVSCLRVPTVRFPRHLPRRVLCLLTLWVPATVMVAGVHRDLSRTR